ncbi:hypothetical protein OIU76_013621 [Salix suchowensis]|nr:hypothetical protein OIU76_013621 [Salix suchowensis]
MRRAVLFTHFLTRSQHNLSCLGGFGTLFYLFSTHCTCVNYM